MTIQERNGELAVDSPWSRSDCDALILIPVRPKEEASLASRRANPPLPAQGFNCSTAEALERMGQYLSMSGLGGKLKW